jgi:putative tryptophan/tyrosine transport system substrate-binding protein
MALLAGGAMAACSFLWPLAAHAQQRVLIIAILGSAAADADASKMQMELLNASMRELGLVDGKDYVLETRWAGSDSSRFPALAAELLALHPAAVVVSTILAARAVQSLSRTVPIVMTGLNDPIAVGLVESLAHPGRNITGVSSMADEIVFKSVEIMREILPQLRNLTAMFNPTNPSNPIMLKTLTNKLANGELSIASIGVRSPADLDSAFTEMSRQHPGALIVLADNSLQALAGTIIARALALRVPTLGSFTLASAQVGALINYARDSHETFQATARLLKKIALLPPIYRSSNRPSSL